MQNVGFTLSIYPALERLYPGEQDRKQAVIRQLEQINTHPSMGPLLVGLVARLERDLEPSSAAAYRRRIMSALAAYGDRFFWTHLKPLAIVWGFFLAILFFGSTAGCVLLLVVYNVPQLIVRARGFDQGWTKGFRLLEQLKSPELSAAVLAMRALVALGLGLVAGAVVLVAMKLPVIGSGSMAPSLAGLVLIGIAGSSLVVLRQPVSFTALLYLATMAAVSIFMLVDAGMVPL